MFLEWIWCVLSEELSFEFFLPYGPMLTKKKKRRKKKEKKIVKQSANVLLALKYMWSYCKKSCKINYFYFIFELNLNLMFKTSFSICLKTTNAHHGDAFFIDIFKNHNYYVLPSSPYWAAFFFHLKPLRNHYLSPKKSLADFHDPTCELAPVGGWEIYIISLVW